ncbi:hypothetical protein BE11_39135 [Sorangium cellulosum]|nr:hypothetical protein BE11_39135 [Sorangium cellulosum]
MLCAVRSGTLDGSALWTGATKAMQMASCAFVEASSVRSALQPSRVGAAAMGDDGAGDDEVDALSSAWASGAPRGMARPMKTPAMPATSANRREPSMVMRGLAATADSLVVQAVRYS